MANINKELNDIKNAIYGKEVRGSIHDGIKKINEESEESKQKAEESKQKAEEAHDITQDLLDESFDSAALEVNFEQRLDDEIANLQPEWTQFKDQINEQLAQTRNVLSNENFYNSLINHKHKEPTVVWIDDDGRAGVYTKIKPILEEYGIVANSAIITSRPHNFPLDWIEVENPNNVTVIQYEEMVEMRNLGLIEFLGHTHRNIRVTDYSDEDLYRDLEINKKILKTLNLGGDHFVYPFGANDERTQNVVRRLFKSAFTTQRGIVEGNFNQYAINRVSLDTDSIADLKARLDEAYDKNALLVAFSHIDEGGGLDLAKTREFIEYALGKGFKFKTVSQAMNDFGHLAQFDDTTINSLGEIDSKTIGVYRNGHLDYTPNAPITDFKKGTVTRLKITQANNADYGVLEDTRSDLSLFGYIEVYRDSTDDFFSFRKLYDIYNNQKYVSRWLKNEGEWGRWETEGNFMYLNTDNFEEPRKPSEYSDLKVHVEKVRNVDASNYNLDGGGMVYTSKDNETSYATQTYIPSRGSASKSPIKIRHQQLNNDEWGSWLSLPLSDRRYERTINATINANSSTETYLDSTGIIKEAFYINKPNQAVPNGITIDTYCVQDGRLTIKITNATNSDVTLADFKMEIRKLLF